MDQAFQRRITAYSGLSADEQPAIWTPELVGQRMIEAFEILARMPIATRPKAFGSSWPEFRLEWEDLLDEDAWKNRVGAMRDGRDLPPDRHEVSRCEESLAWPSRFLTDDPMQRDALQVWARCKAESWSIRFMLAKRARKAEALADAMTIAENKRRAALRFALAKEVATWANRRLAQAKNDPERRQNIKVNAEIRMQREVKARDLYTTLITPVQAMPGKVLKEKTLERYRKAACDLLADRLNAAGVVVRTDGL